MYCPKCGTEVQQGAKFCPKCGNSMGQASQARFDTGQDQPTQRFAPQHGNPFPFASTVVISVVVVGVAIFAVWIFFFAPYKVDEATFPDTAMRTVVSNQVDVDKNGEISRDEAANVTSFSVDGATNLDGIRYFPNIKTLSAKGSALSSADLSPLASLESFEAPDSSLTELDVSRNHALTTLDVPDTTQVNGLEATQLIETWLPVSSKKITGGSDIDEEEKAGNEVKRDAHGNPTSYIYNSYSTSGGYLSTSTTDYTYDDLGRIASSTTSSTSSSSSGSSEDSSTYSYDDAGRLASISKDTSSGEASQEFSYNSEGQIISSAYVYSSSTSDPTVTKIDYDDKGQPVAIRNETGYSENQTVEKYTWNDIGQITSCESPMPRTFFFKNHKVTYDDQGNIATVECVPGEAYTQNVKESAPTYDNTVTYTYDENGRLTGGTSVQNLDSSYSQDLEGTCTYDDAGNLIRAEVVSTSTHDGKSTTYTTAYEQTYERYFVLQDDDTDKTFLYIKPSLDEQVFNAYAIEPALPHIPNLSEQYVAFEFNIYPQY